MNQSYSDLFDTPKFLVDIPAAEPTYGGEYTTTKFHSETIEFDAVIARLNIGDTSHLELKCNLLKMPVPEKWTESAVLNITMLATLTSAGYVISRFIHRDFPDGPPNEYYDFTGEADHKKTFCTDNGRLLWEIIRDKWDIRFVCTSKNRRKDR